MQVRFFGQQRCVLPPHTLLKCTTAAKPHSSSMTCASCAMVSDERCRDCAATLGTVPAARKRAKVASEYSVISVSSERDPKRTRGPQPTAPSPTYTYAGCDVAEPAGVYSKVDRPENLGKMA